MRHTASLMIVSFSIAASAAAQDIHLHTSWSAKAGSVALRLQHGQVALVPGQPDTAASAPDA